MANSFHRSGRAPMVSPDEAFRSAQSRASRLAQQRRQAAQRAHNSPNPAHKRKNISNSKSSRPVKNSSRLSSPSSSAQKAPQKAPKPSSMPSSIPPRNLRHATFLRFPLINGPTLCISETLSLILPSSLPPILAQHIHQPHHSIHR